jgi:hypothetical protein
MKSNIKIIVSIFLLAIAFNFKAQAETKPKPKYAISMFHFNFQYVAGDYKIESRIVRESLFPALQFFEKNPKLKANFEFQAYAIESMAEDFPQVLKLLKKLINRGQIELVIAHYSDQFFIAYPALDLQKSIEISDRILKKYGMERSRVFFGQEIQYSPGTASALKGKYDVVVTSSDPHGYYRGDTPPLVNVNYGDDTILGLIGAGEKNLKNLEWTWAFLDDGEVFNTLDYRSDFYFVPEQEKKHIDHYRKLEKEGYEFVTMSKLVEILQKDKDYKIEDYPYVPEGTWNMSVCGPYMWMGRQRSGVETDGITRALSYELRGEILATEKLISYVENQGIATTDMLALLDKAWRHLLLSEVSDSSGWTPWLSEVQYTANEVANARRELKKINDLLVKVLPKDVYLEVNTRTGSVNKKDKMPTNISTEAYLPIALHVRAASYSTSVIQLNEDLYQLDINCKRPTDGAVEIAFDTADSSLAYSAGTGEEVIVEIPTDFKHDPNLALSNGFLYLGNGYSIIKDCSVEHLAVTWRQSDKRAVFRQELNENNPEMNMRFYIYKGDKTVAHKLSNNLNTWPFFIVNNNGETLELKKIFPVK